MKRLVLIILIITLVALANLFSDKFSMTGKAETLRRQQAIVEITEPVKLLGVILKGDYLFVHDEEKMAQGAPCSYIYSLRDGKTDRLVASYHCVHMNRPAAETFILRLSHRISPSSLREVEEFQFAGTRDGHRIP
jgi:hypothetical protein